MEIVENRGLLLKTRKADEVTKVIRKSRKLGKVHGTEDIDEVVVHWGLDEVLALRAMGFSKVPSPILKNYNWPGINKPFEHQKHMASFHAAYTKCFNFSEAGTGKTSSVLWAADYLMNEGKIKRVLVVCPLSIMRTAWVDEAFRTVMHRTCAIAYHKEKKKREEVILGPYEFVIINYDGVELVKDAIKEANFDLIVVDEANAYKNSRTIRWKTLNSLLRPHTWLWMMTGTPAAQSPVDAYGLGKMLCPNRVPQFYGSFRDKVLIKISQFKWIPRPNAPEIVHNALKPAIRYTKDECLDLPDMMYTAREVELTPQQNKYYKKLKLELYLSTAGEHISAVNAAAMFNKLLQLSCGAVYSDGGEVISFDVSNRLKALKEIIEETSHKVIVYAPFRHTIDLIVDYLKGEKITTEVVQGGMSPNARTEIFRRFQDTPDPKVIVIQPQAAAHGVTLTRADTIVWFGPTTSLDTYIQANARAHRMGQKNKVTVVQIRGSDVEKKLYRALDAKIDVHQEIVKLYMETISEKD